MSGLFLTSVSNVFAREKTIACLPHFARLELGHCDSMARLDNLLLCFKLLGQCSMAAMTCVGLKHSTTLPHVDCGVSALQMKKIATMEPPEGVKTRHHMSVHVMIAHHGMNLHVASVGCCTVQSKDNNVAVGASIQNDQSASAVCFRPACWHHDGQHAANTASKGGRHTAGHSMCFFCCC